MTRHRLRSLALNAEHLRLMLAYHDAEKGDRRRRLRELKTYTTRLLSEATTS